MAKIKVANFICKRLMYSTSGKHSFKNSATGGDCIDIKTKKKYQTVFLAEEDKKMFDLEKEKYDKNKHNPFVEQ
jgi:hypothetical protein